MWGQHHNLTQGILKFQNMYELKYCIVLNKKKLFKGVNQQPAQQPQAQQSQQPQSQHGQMPMKTGVCLLCIYNKKMEV